MNNEYYDLQHLKAIPIADYLHTTYGIEPAKRYNGYALYHAPYREDFNASMRLLHVLSERSIVYLADY